MQEPESPLSDQGIRQDQGASAPAVARHTNLFPRAKAIAAPVAPVETQLLLGFHEGEIARRSPRLPPLNDDISAESILRQWAFDRQCLPPGNGPPLGDLDSQGH